MIMYNDRFSDTDGVETGCTKIASVDDTFEYVSLHRNRMGVPPGI